MNRLPARLIPWALLCGFLCAAFTLFSLAAGPDALQLPGVFSLSSLWAERPAKGEIRRAVSRLRLAEQEAGHWLLDHAGKALETEAARLQTQGKRLEGLAGGAGEGDQPDDDAPFRLRSHQFSETAKGFAAVFATDREPGQARVYFLRGPARHVVELHGLWQNDAPRLNSLRGHLVSRVVIDAHETFLRVVFHLTDANAGPEHSRLDLERGPTGFTVSIKRPH